MFPVMLATNTWPSVSTLTASTIPVAKTSEQQLTTVNLPETGDTTGMLPCSYSCGVRSNDVTVDLR